MGRVKPHGIAALLQNAVRLTWRSHTHGVGGLPLGPESAFQYCLFSLHDQAHVVSICSVAIYTKTSFLLSSLHLFLSRSVGSSKNWNADLRVARARLLLAFLC